MPMSQSDPMKINAGADKRGKPAVLIGWNNCMVKCDWLEYIALK